MASSRTMDFLTDLVASGKLSTDDFEKALNLEKENKRKPVFFTRINLVYTTLLDSRIVSNKLLLQNANVASGDASPAPNYITSNNAAASLLHLSP